MIQCNAMIVGRIRPHPAKIFPAVSSLPASPAARVTQQHKQLTSYFLDTSLLHTSISP